MISIRISLCLAPLGVGAATAALAQAPTTLSSVPAVSKTGSAKPTPPIGEMVPRGAAPMSLRSVGAPNILGSDDVISVSVIGHPEFSLPEATISSAGQISHPLGGLVKVSGLTLSGAAQAIRKSLSVYMKKPVVTVGLVRPHARQVFVYGAVKVPGIINIGEGWRVSEAISAVAGLARRPEMTALSLTRRGQKTQQLDLQTILDAPNSPANLELRPGDSLRFDERSVQVSVVGQVKSPGFLEMSVGSRLYDAILQAGGTLPRAALSKATLKRASGTILPLNLLQAAPGGVPSGAKDSNPTLLSGDFISVPEQQARITILGSVTKPGPVELPEGKTLRVTDALAAAGGLSIEPRQARIGIARYLPDGRLIPIDIDPKALLVENDLSQNAVLSENDLITVSELKTRTVFVTGQVNRPGAFVADPSEGITQLLTRAGGPNPSAALRRVSVTRRGVPVATLDMLGAMAGGAAPAVELQDGDLISVPRNEARVMVMPAVRNPGVVMIPEDRVLTIGDAISLAGGPQVGAKLKEVVIFRETPQGVTSQLVSLTPKPGAPLPTNIVLQDRDFLFVPEGNRNRINPVDVGLRAFGALSFLLR